MVERAAQQVLKVVEASYSLDLGHQEWFQRVVDALRPIVDSGMGIVGHTFRTNAEGRYDIESAVLAGEMSVERAEAIARGLSAYRPEEARSFTDVECGTISQMWTKFGRDYYESGVFREVHPYGIQDAVGFGGKDPSGCGYAIVAPLPRQDTTPRRTQARWKRAALHILASMRLRAPSQRAEGEAVIDARHRVVHAEGAAQNALEVLRQAAVTVDRARSQKGRRDPDAALEAWRALVRGRWSLVDRFERDGRRYIVALNNEPDPSGPSALSRRELQVLRLAAGGLANKEIAYALGLAPSTVSSHLRSAASKLRLRGRADFAGVFGLPR